jgi:hypothetical protein
VRKSAFKKGSISQAIAMPRSFCIHHALPPSEPPDGVRRCSLEGSASGPPPPVIPPPESSRSWWCCRSCLLLAVVRGAQPRGGWRSSNITRLQGFSSRSPAAISRQWSPRGMTTSLVVGRSKPGCGLPPALSFKDVHHPCWGGERAELGPRLPHGLAAHFFLQHSGEKGVRQPCEGGELRVRGAGRLQAPPATACPMPRLGGFDAASDAASCCLVGAWLSAHRTGDSRAVRRSATSTVSLAPLAALGGRTRRRTPRGWRPRSWMVLSSLHRRTGARTSSHVLRQPPPTGAEVAAVVSAEVVVAAGEATRCRGGCLHWRDHQRHLPPSLQLFGFNGLIVAPVGRRGRGPFRNGARAEVIASAGEPLRASYPAALLVWR